LEILEYPFDGCRIIAKKRQIKKELINCDVNWLKKRIAILGGSTTDDVKQILELFLLDNGIMPEFYESEYNQYYEEAMFPNDELKKFAPDMIYIHTTHKNISVYPSLTENEGKIENMLGEEEAKYTAMWDHLAEEYKCPVIQNNFDYPSYRILGNMENYDVHGKINYINRLNSFFGKYAAGHDNFYIQDIQYLQSECGMDIWYDAAEWYLYKYAVSLRAIPMLAYDLANIIKAVYGKNKKALVLDLDNTLWGGIVGDDGAENLEMGPESAAGEAFGAFQNYLKELKDTGIILNVDSKNDEENALAGLKHRDCVLSPDDFISIKANWEPKSKNFIDIADELNIMPDSMVFVDDNPAEREIVKRQIPGARAPAMPCPEKYIEMIDRGGFFEVTSLSEDDMHRNEMYKANARREKIKASFENYDDYLRSLDMTAVIDNFEPVYFQRIAQLTNKSNQFNLTTKRYSSADIEKITDSHDYITMYGKLKDKFGDNGVVSLVVGKRENDTLHIILWLMSCRVLKRKMECAMMDSLVKKARAAGVRKIIGYYLPTAKNKMVKEFYQQQGFSMESCDDTGKSVWSCRLDGQYRAKNDVINVTEAV
jgi:HAD-superfamily phosphatase, subfamily IIIC/FkbH-like domain